MTAILFFIGAFVIIFAVFHLAYIGRTAAKKVDRIVYGYEYPNDSIFSLLIRAPTYASAFLWHWSAKRSGLADKVEQVDPKSKRMFILNFYLFLFGGSCMVVAVVADKIF